jgi:resuscitation-promoting factor RpfB
MRVRRSVLLSLVLAMVVLASGAAGAFAVSSAVEVAADGEVHSIRTFAGDVATVLDRLDIEVGEADLVEPPPGTAVENGLRIVVSRAKTVEVVVDDSPPEVVVAVAGTVADVLSAAGLADLLDREARIEPSPDDAIADGDRIVVTLPLSVTVAADGDEQQLVTYATTVAEALEDGGIGLGDDDLVEPPLEEALEEDAVIIVRRVEIVDEVVQVEIAPGEQRRETQELVSGQTRVEVEGEAGMREETWTVTRIDGEESERELVEEKVLRQPTDRVVLVGSAPAPLREAQELLAGLGYPVGSVDGTDGAQTRQALCAWRRLEGGTVSRQSLQAGELDALRASGGLPAADAAGRGVTVDRTCQVLYLHEGGRWQQVHRASTGADGLPQPGSYRIQRTRPGWHTSTLYPAPQPNMYNTLYFHGAIAIHGSNHVPSHPASAGCVRVTPPSADTLFGRLGVGDSVRVIGAY